MDVCNPYLRYVSVARDSGAIQKNGRQPTKAIHQISLYPSGKLV
jgi:hypothetical protein